MSTATNLPDPHAFISGSHLGFLGPHQRRPLYPGGLMNYRVWQTFWCITLLVVLLWPPTLWNMPLFWLKSLDYKFLVVNRFSIFFAAHFMTKGILNNDKIIFVWGCLIALWYAKNLLLKDVAYRVYIGSSCFQRFKDCSLSHMCCCIYVWSYTEYLIG